MDDRAPRSPLRLPLAVVCAALCVAGAAHAGSAPPFAARAGLVYVENDEALDGAGVSPRWSYLFYSASEDRARLWSVRGGRIAAAENLDMRFDAPPVASGWLDSGAALAAAERGGGAEFRKDHGGRLETMLLMRGAFSEGDPDETTWTLVYRAQGVPSLFVVVSAADGKVQRTWRG